MTVSTTATTASLHFDYHPTSRVRFGPGSLEQLGQAAKDLGASTALLVTDPGLVEAGHAASAQAILERTHVTVHTFSDVFENPTDTLAAQCADFAREVGPVDLIIALGGGSAMDCAKAANFLLSNGGVMEDYWGKEKAKLPMLPSIGVPTTAGTGSEAQRFALISRATDHKKMACGDIKARFTSVILDPELLASAPQWVSAHSGMDAVTHAVEAFVTKSRNPMSQLFAREAWRLLEANFERVLEAPQDLEAQSHMMLGAHYAGSAIELSMLGAAHGCANPLTAQFGVTHGVAVAMMLPHVIRFNRDTVGELYTDLVHVAKLSGSDPIEALAERVAQLRDAAGMESSLAAFDIDEQHLDALAADATTQWTGTFNPRSLTHDDFLALYRAALV